MAEYRIPNINSVLITGRATADSILSYTESGSAYLKFRIASNRNFKDKSGEWKEETTFAGITLWGNQAERLSERIKKGVPVMVEGRLSSYTREVDGFKRTELSINAFRVQVLLKSTTPYPENGTEKTEEELAEDTTEATEDMESPPEDDEELPF
ncbi:single-stranded DNA-binding protein [candidate division WOR-3 bacterium]|nr:single-stranded DNA-binding protein [candidate division WOR-3 bacterium]